MENLLVTCGKLLICPHKRMCICGKPWSYPQSANRFSTSFPPSYPQKRASYPQLTLDKRKKKLEEWARRSRAIGFFSGPNRAREALDLSGRGPTRRYCTLKAVEGPSSSQSPWFELFRPSKADWTDYTGRPRPIGMNCGAAQRRSRTGNL